MYQRAPSGDFYQVFYDVKLGFLSVLIANTKNQTKTKLASVNRNTRFAVDCVERTFRTGLAYPYNKTTSSGSLVVACLLTRSS